MVEVSDSNKVVCLSKFFWLKMKVVFLVEIL